LKTISESEQEKTRGAVGVKRKEKKKLSVRGGRGEKGAVGDDSNRGGRLFRQGRYEISSWFLRVCKGPGKRAGASVSTTKKGVARAVPRTRGRVFGAGKRPAQRFCGHNEAGFERKWNRKRFFARVSLKGKACERGGGAG